jgi:hypothetical protein
MYQSTRWKSADLELLPDSGNRYAIVTVYRWWRRCLLVML